ncbi:uncharacterized protein [Phyllobates terribilis]|uniref:uncharacterized protein n=1 Tax=Phyllobates terribilis TaxID=111132 RepID=UPI003CCB5A18
MEISYLLMLSMVSAAVVVQPSSQVTALSESSIELKTSFDHANVKDFTWNRKTLQGYYRIIKIKNGSVVENLNNRYKPALHGTVLGINNLTKSDSGNYTAVITMWDNFVKEENIDLTVYDSVPTPEIKSEVERIGNQCNVTLNISIPSDRDSFYYTWKYRHGDSEYQNINSTVNTIQMLLPLDLQDTEFMCIVQNPADQKNATVQIKNCSEVKSNTASIVIGVVVLVVVVVALLVWRFKFSKRSSNTSKQDSQKDQVKTSKKENTVEEDENYKNKNEEYLRDSVYYQNDQDEGQAEEDENEIKEHKKKFEHQNEANLTRPVPEVGIHRVWTTGNKGNDVKKHKKEDEHRNKDENREICMQDSSVTGDKVRKDEVQEHEKKGDYENDEESPLFEETDVTTALNTRSDGYRTILLT